MFRFLGDIWGHLTTRIMYTPPSPRIISQLIDHTVEMISFGQYVVHISFSNGDRLSLTCPFRFDAEGVVARSSIHEAPINESNMLRVVGSSIIDARCERDGTLRLKFKTGDILIAYANNPGYEAYSLKIRGEEYVI